MGWQVIDYNFGRRVLRRVDMFKSVNDTDLDRVYDALKVIF